LFIFDAKLARIYIKLIFAILVLSKNHFGATPSGQIVKQPPADLQEKLTKAG